MQNLLILCMKKFNLSIFSNKKKNCKFTLSILDLINDKFIFKFILINKNFLKINKNVKN